MTFGVPMLLTTVPSVLFACKKGGTVHVHWSLYMGDLNFMFWM